jgi:hypothetical protein
MKEQRLYMIIITTKWCSEGIISSGVYKLNYNVYNMNTRQKYNFHLRSSNLSLYQKGVYFTGIKVVNNLPQSIKNLSNDTTV